jgi:NAD(P)H dehydrogenase (quinone)
MGRSGRQPIRIRQLIDSTASLWLKGEMEGKPAGVFTCTASTHCGQETTLRTMTIPLLHLGVLIVGVPIYSCWARFRNIRFIRPRRF